MSKGLANQIALGELEHAVVRRVQVLDPPLVVGDPRRRGAVFHEPMEQFLGPDPLEAPARGVRRDVPLTDWIPARFRSFASRKTIAVPTTCPPSSAEGQGLPSMGMELPALPISSVVSGRSAG